MPLRRSASQSTVAAAAGLRLDPRQPDPPRMVRAQPGHDRLVPLASDAVADHQVRVALDGEDGSLRHPGLVQPQDVQPPGAGRASRVAGEQHQRVLADCHDRRRVEVVGDPADLDRVPHPRPAPVQAGPEHAAVLGEVGPGQAGAGAGPGELGVLGRRPAGRGDGLQDAVRGDVSHSDARTAPACGEQPPVVRGHRAPVLRLDDLLEHPGLPADLGVGVQRGGEHVRAAARAPPRDQQPGLGVPGQDRVDAVREEARLVTHSPVRRERRQVEPTSAARGERPAVGRGGQGQ